jgi:hypothetical protein
LDEALVSYKEAEILLYLLGGRQRLAWALGSSTYEAGIAYHDFRRGLEETARGHLGFAMDADLSLEDAGLTVMQLHRIQQGHNLARMHWRLGRRGAAIRLCGSLIAYMESQVRDLPFHRDWRPRAVPAIPRELLQSMMAQILDELAGPIVGGSNANDEWSWLVESSQLCSNPERAVFPQVQFALLAQSDRLASQWESYLLNLERFLSLGVHGCCLLWYAIVAELAEFCLEADTHRSHEIRAAILRDSVKWRGLPPLLRDQMLASPAEAGR